jgi:hypothetical protein
MRRLIRANPLSGKGRVVPHSSHNRLAPFVPNQYDEGILLRFCLAVVTTLTLLAAPVRAEPEVHVVGVYEGLTQTDGTVHGPKAQVLLDRPGAEVILVLSSYEPLRWLVELGRDTPMPTVVLAQYDGDGRKSEVWLDGEILADPVRMELPLTYKPEGIDFRDLVRLVSERFGVERMASFSGGYTASPLAYIISGPVDDPRHDADYLQGELNPAAAPASLQPLIGPLSSKAEPDVTLGDQGFEVLTPEAAPKLIPLPLDMPEVSWPVGAVRDPETATLYGVTLGGEGFLFAYDETAATWRVVRSMDQLDAQALFLDATGRRLIMPLGLGAPGRIAVIDLRDGDSAAIQIVTLDRQMPGYADLYDPGNGPAPALVPVGIDGDRLLLIAQGSGRGFRAQIGGGDAQPWRAYLVDLSTATVDLVGYAGG